MSWTPIGAIEVGWTIVDLEYEIEFVCFIGRRVNLMPYIKDIRIDSVLFHHFTWSKAYATQMSENWISRDCHNETANEGKEASGSDQPETEVLTVIFHSWEIGKFMFVLTQKESWKSINI